MIATLSQLPSILIDPSAESQKYLLLAIFHRTKSQYFERALSIISGLSRYESFDDNRIHVAWFEKTAIDATKAMSVIASIESLKQSGRLYFCGGRINNNLYKMKLVLNCYIQSFLTTNIQAHCCRIEEHPFSRIGTSSQAYQRITFGSKLHMRLLLNPCKYLNLQGLNQHHPASLAEQIQARAIEENVDWCPRFDLSNTKDLQ